MRCACRAGWESGRADERDHEGPEGRARRDRSAERSRSSQASGILRGAAAAEMDGMFVVSIVWFHLHLDVSVRTFCSLLLHVRTTQVRWAHLNRGGLCGGVSWRRPVTTVSPFICMCMYRLLLLSCCCCSCIANLVMMIITLPRLACPDAPPRPLITSAKTCPDAAHSLL